MFGYEFYYKIAKGLKSLRIFEFSADKAYKRKEDDDYVYEIEVKRYLYPKGENTRLPYYIEFTNQRFATYTGETLNDLAKGIFQVIFITPSGYNWE